MTPKLRTKTVIHLSIPSNLDKRVEDLMARYAALDEDDQEEFLDTIVELAEDQIEEIECRG